MLGLTEVIGLRRVCACKEGSVTDDRYHDSVTTVVLNLLCRKMFLANICVLVYIHSVSGCCDSLTVLGACVGESKGGTPNLPFSGSLLSHCHSCRKAQAQVSDSTSVALPGWRLSAAWHYDSESSRCVSCLFDSLTVHFTAVAGVGIALHGLFDSGRLIENQTVGAQAFSCNASLIVVPVWS